ncbi:MAG TPA: RNA 2',3'-cyclic phosphodiesterase [Thermoanaerobaculia bacterium]|jgi:2'-5' RNA ligase|nr:RNA 2',3'-cyclic phosphodiesterase [Thermoanaerobaculia bacterium]
MRGEDRPRARDHGEDAAAPTGSLRLFVAFALSDEVRAAMRRRLGRLRSLVPQARWVDPDNAHLTLAFLGHQPEERVALLAAALRDVFWRYPAMPLRLHGGGTFPQGRPARVAWVGVRAPAELLPLQHDVADAAAGVLDWEPEKRPFHPHVTLTRCNPAWPRAQAERFHSEVQGSWGEEFVADEGVLYRSRLSPRGAQYEAIERFPLRKPEPA